MIDRHTAIGYLRVTSFWRNTLRDFDAVVQRLTQEGLRGLIIDLRFNPGGLMHQAVAMVDRSVREGVILSTVTRRRAVEEYRATSHGTIDDVKLAVLINGSSGSSSEIVAGALQALDRAIVVGERSFGKGSVQNLIHLSDQKGAIKLTVAYYRLPDGRIIHRTAKNAGSDLWGVIPDLQVELSDEEVRAIRESRRALHLAFVEPPAPLGSDDRRRPTDQLGSATQLPGVEQFVVESETREIVRDRQLNSALKLLRKQLDEGDLTDRH